MLQRPKVVPIGGLDIRLISRLHCIIMASPVPIHNPDININMLSHMPSPQGKSSLCFRGKDIDNFLSKYEYFAIHANLMDEKKCKEIRIYFARKENCVLDVLTGYLTRDWHRLKRELRSLYTSSIYASL